MDFYDEEKKHAYPWSMAWPKLKYIFLGKEDILKVRRRLADKINDLSQLPDKELEPEFEKYILPCTDSKKNPIDYYDPLEDYINTPLPKDPDYLELVDLDLSDEQAILNFVNRNGLLGILFHNYKYTEITYPPNVKKDNDQNFDGDKSKIQSESEEDEFYLLSKINFEYMPYAIQSRENKTIEVDTFINHALWLGYGEGGTGLFPLTNKEINDKFFPISGDPYDPAIEFFDTGGWNLLLATKGSQLQLPIFKQTWHELYAEPLELFIKEASIFISTYKRVVDFCEAHKKNDDIKPDTYSLYGNFNKHLRGIHPRPRYLNKREFLNYGWEVPSLLSAYYLMLYLDLSNKRKAKFCDYRKCLRPFIADRDDNKYCSFRCKDIAKKDRKRNPQYYSNKQK